MRVLTLSLLALCLAAAEEGPLPVTLDPQAAAAETETPPPVTCPAGGPIGDINLEVQAGKNTELLPFRTINHLTEGDTLHYAPILHGKEKRVGEVAMVLVPVKRKPDSDPLIVTDPKPADKSQDWKIPEPISLAAFVYGPQGLSKRKVKGFLSQDDLLIAQLADYAEKTAQTEALVQALSKADSSSASVNAALSGFASQYGLAAQLDRNAPPAAQAQTLFAAMNPQLATYNPLASSSAERVGQTASLTAAAATLFFGSPIGLAAGGTAMLLDLRAIAFPNTEFRSSFAQPLAKGGLDLCGQRRAAPPHTRVAFIWASRIPNTPPPAIHIAKTNYIPLRQKASVQVDVPDAEWKYLQRARAWSLRDEKGESKQITVLKLGNQRAVEIDLTKSDLLPGDYRLSGFWDWAPFEADGIIHLKPLSDFAHAQLEPASQDKLLADTGKIPVVLTGDDFEFTTAVEMKKLGDEFARPESIPFILHKGLRQGPQSQMDVQIDTSARTPGTYALLVTQQDGRAHEVPFHILPKPPNVDNLPILANQGVATQHYMLKGERLNLLARLEATGAKFELGAPEKAGTERDVKVQLESDPRPGTTLPVEAFLVDRSEPLMFSNALQITGPLPVIASSKLSLPNGMAISVLQDEFPAGYTLTAVLDVKNIGPTSLLRLGCTSGIGPRTALHVGEQNQRSSLQQLSQDQLFLSFDTTDLPAGCSLQATIDNGIAGQSQPFTLAYMTRLPQIDSFEATATTEPNGMRTYLITGRNLEFIEKVGWNKSEGTDVSGLPTPIPQQGQKQSLQVALPAPPSDQAPVFLWLRGEKEGRATTIVPSAGITGTVKPAVTSGT